MDFHTLSRRELQALCKKNKIPANITNVAMADALSSLPKVEGVDDIQSLMTPLKLNLATTPRPPRSASVKETGNEDNMGGIPLVGITETPVPTSTRRAPRARLSAKKAVVTPAAATRRSTLRSSSRVKKEESVPPVSFDEIENMKQVDIEEESGSVVTEETGKNDGCDEAVESAPSAVKNSHPEEAVAESEPVVGDVEIEESQLKAEAGGDVAEEGEDSDSPVGTLVEVSEPEITLQEEACAETESKVPIPEKSSGEEILLDETIPVPVESESAFEEQKSVVPEDVIPIPVEEVLDDKENLPELKESGEQKESVIAENPIPVPVESGEKKEAGIPVPPESNTEEVPIPVESHVVVEDIMRDLLESMEMLSPSSAISKTPMSRKKTATKPKLNGNQENAMSMKKTVKSDLNDMSLRQLKSAFKTLKISENNKAVVGGEEEGKKKRSALSTLNN